MSREIKKYTVRWDYYAHYGSYDRSNSETYRVKSTNYAKLKAKLEKCLSKDDHEGLSKLLQGRYIDPVVQRKYSVVTHDTFNHRPYIVMAGGVFPGVIVPRATSNVGQRDTYTYEDHFVSSVLGELVEFHNHDFRGLLKLAKGQCRQALLNFEGMDLGESDLSGIDLSGANFKDAKLKQTHGLSQEALDSAQTCVGATLPDGFTAYLSQAQVKCTLAEIQKLRAYGLKLQGSQDKEGNAKGAIAVDLANTLSNMLTRPGVKFNGKFQAEFLKTLHSQDEAFSQKRYCGLKAILANIALFIVGFGVGYVAALAVYRHNTGRHFFFDKTTTEERVEAVEKTLGPSMAISARA